nr:hypothetical protein CFP56_03014 [Quercus suber]
MGKAVEDEGLARLEHEADIYSALASLQGHGIPVSLAVIHPDPRMPWLDGPHELRLVLLLNYAGTCMAQPGLNGIYDGTQVKKVIDIHRPRPGLHVRLGLSQFLHHLLPAGYILLPGF